VSKTWASISSGVLSGTIPSIIGDEIGYTLDQLFQAHKHRLVKAASLGLSLIRVPVSCGNGLHGAIVFSKGYKEPDLETRPGKLKAPPPWAAFFTTDLSLTAVQVVHKYLGRWSIEVFFKKAKQRLGLGQEQGRSFAAQVFSVTQAFFRYSLLAYLLEHDERSQTIGEMFRQLEEETGKLTYLERLWHYLVTFLKTAGLSQGQGAGDCLIPSCNLKSNIEIRKVRHRTKFFRVAGQTIQALTEMVLYLIKIPAGLIRKIFLPQFLPNMFGRI
jgi:hypothetical protein